MQTTRGKGHDPAGPEYGRPHKGRRKSHAAVFWGVSRHPAHRPTLASKNKGATSKELALFPLLGKTGQRAEGSRQHASSPSSWLPTSPTPPVLLVLMPGLPLPSAPWADPTPGPAPTAHRIRAGQLVAGSPSAPTSISPQALLGPHLLLSVSLVPRTPDLRVHIHLWGKTWTTVFSQVPSTAAIKWFLLRRESAIHFREHSDHDRNPIFLSEVESGIPPVISHGCHVRPWAVTCS